MMLSIPRTDTNTRTIMNTIARNWMTAVPQRQLRLSASSSFSSSSTTAAAKSISKKPTVISRRAWNKFKESDGLKRHIKLSKPKVDEEKPWPKNFQIAGIVAGTFIIPYIVTWTVTSNPSLRQWLGPYLPLEKFRAHFGELEWDSQSYSDELEEKKGGDGYCNQKYYQFPQELPFHERLRQEIIDDMEKSDVEVTLSLSSSSSSPSPSEFPSAEKAIIKKVPSSTIANLKNLLTFMPATSVSITTNSKIAVDFLDEKKEEISNSFHNDNISDCGELLTDANSVEIDITSTEKHPSGNLSLAERSLAKFTQTVSKWSYVPPQVNEIATIVSQPTELEININRLEYDVDTLEKDLRDPMCTREVDDLQQELRQTKRELSKLKWKKRFGFSR